MAGKIMLFVKRINNLNITKNIDKVLISLVLLISIIGLFVVRSATITRTDGGLKIMISQVVGLLIGIVIAFALGSIDYKNLKVLGVILYIMSTAMLLLVLFAGTGDSLGSRSWLRIGGFTFQPAEFAKVSFIIIAAIFLERIHESTMDSVVNVVKFLIYTSLPIILVLAQHDFGTTMVFIFIFLSMLFAWGLRYRYIMMMIGAFLMTTPLMWFFVLNDRRKDRIKAFINPGLDPNGANFNVRTSKMAIGSGQLWGKGLYRGIQTQNSAVPVNESDFIFSVIGEELGFIGSISIIVILAAIILRCLNIAKNAKDMFGSLLVVGVCSMFAVHLIENIGMSIGLLPVTGIPLPFISAGGSAMVTNYIAIGIVLSVASQQKKSLFANGNF